ncbi:uncharacterized protein EV420DRAFT_1482498 [Desarmillaria tabescens]|uniref:Uncharacterized protein n=1 Tax=Armillaria tabescens TaxID=1929756 RepID=A0AA39JZ27_ARMTA|nr:uncharacterized protein EV420DRAFT_1482498 [Desarmillaria tabescens]KAK0451388.1 hypothetical protein EV420DRAFT_1482498 [Desarmillaria tabescens]
MYYRRWNRGNYQEHCSAWRRISGRDRNEYGGEAIWEVGWRQARLEAFCLVRTVKTDTAFAWCTSCAVQQVLLPSSDRDMADDSVLHYIDENAHPFFGKACCT